MTHYRNNGKPAWHARRGQVAKLERSALEQLVRKGKASWWRAYRDVDSAAEAAGL